MKDRADGYLNPKRMPEDVFDYIVELHEYLWRIVRAVNPGAGGSLQHYVDSTVARLEAARPEVRKSACWFIERIGRRGIDSDGKDMPIIGRWFWVSDTVHYNCGWTDDPLQALRLNRQQDAEAMFALVINLTAGHTLKATDHIFLAPLSPQRKPK